MRNLLTVIRVYIGTFLEFESSFIKLLPKLGSQQESRNLDLVRQLYPKFKSDYHTKPSDLLVFSRIELWSFRFI